MRATTTCMHILSVACYNVDRNSFPRFEYSSTSQDIYLRWHMVLAPAWNSALNSYMWEVNSDHLFNLVRGAVLWEVVDGSRGNYVTPSPISTYFTSPLFSPAVTTWKLTCLGSSHFQQSEHCFATSSCTAAAAAPRGHRLVSACTRRGQGKDWICQSASALRQSRTPGLCLCPGPCHTPTH